MPFLPVSIGKQQPLDSKLMQDLANNDAYLYGELDPSPRGILGLAEMFQYNLVNIVSEWAVVKTTGEEILQVDVETEANRIIKVEVCIPTVAVAHDAPAYPRYWDGFRIVRDGTQLTGNFGAWWFEPTIPVTPRYSVYMMYLDVPTEGRHIYQVEWKVNDMPGVAIEPGVWYPGNTETQDYPAQLIVEDIGAVGDVAFTGIPESEIVYDEITSPHIDDMVQRVRRAERHNLGPGVGRF